MPADFTAPDIDPESEDGPGPPQQQQPPNLAAPQPSVDGGITRRTIEVSESTFGPFCPAPGSSLSSASSSLSAVQLGDGAPSSSSMGAGGIAFIILLCGLVGFGAYTIFSRRSQVKGLKVEKDQQQQARDTFANMLVRSQASQSMGTVCMSRASLAPPPSCTALHYTALHCTALHS